MSDHNPNFHQRRSIRLKGYDYSKTGLYFITVCTQNRECFFGEICPVGGVESVGAPLCGCPNDSTIKIGYPPKMILNNAGEMIAKWYNELENKYPKIRCHEMVVMPNHFHCIVEIAGKYGYDLSDGIGLDDQDAHVGAPLRGRPLETNNKTKYGPENKIYDATIGDIFDWFKTMTTNEYIRGVKNLGWKRFNCKLWQRNYWEHIIRDDDSYQQIAAYILQNPLKWNDDQLNLNFQI